MCSNLFLRVFRFILKGPEWTARMERRVHMRLGFGLFDKELGERVASNLISFDQVFLDNYENNGVPERECSAERTATPGLQTQY